MNNILATAAVFSQYLQGMIDIPGAIKTLDDIKSTNGHTIAQEEFLGSQNDWPKLNVPYNSEIKSTVYTWNHEDKKLENFRDMKTHLYVDTDGNRELMMLHYNAPFFGKETINVYADFNRGVLVKSMDEVEEFCREAKLGKKISLKAWIDKLKCPEGGITEYLGEKTVGWVDGKFNAFRINIVMKEFTKTEVLYFGLESMELEWIETIKPLPFIIGIENGLRERRFTDEDFKDVRTSCKKEVTIEEALGWV